MKVQDHLPPSSSSSGVSQTALFFFVSIIVANTLYVTSVSRRELLSTKNEGGLSLRERPIAASSRVPDVVIYRKTKKTGSTSGLDAILKGLLPKRYAPLHNDTSVIKDILRAEALKSSPRKLLVSCHNGISREHTGNLFTVITDTVKDGYHQMTSFCRYFREVKECDSDEMRECLHHANLQYQVKYRWAGRSKEDSETYIDLPMSVAHPGLSTTVFRQVFPNVTLDFPQINAVGSTCEDIPSVRKVYDELFADLENQVLKLRNRMLTLAGYPTKLDGYSVVQLMDAADKTERSKYQFGRKSEPRKEFGETINDVRASAENGAWYISEDGRLVKKEGL